jgi:hypothetical protein
MRAGAWARLSDPLRASVDPPRSGPAKTAARTLVHSEFRTRESDPNDQVR